MLVAPVLKEAAQSVDVLLPGQGLWYDGHTGELIDSGERLVQSICKLFGV